MCIYIMTWFCPCHSVYLRLLLDYYNLIQLYNFMHLKKAIYYNELNIKSHFELLYLQEGQGLCVPSCSAAAEERVCSERCG